MNNKTNITARMSSDGSTLVFDYPDENFFDAPERRVQNTIMMAKMSKERRFSL